MPNKTKSQLSSNCRSGPPPSKRRALHIDQEPLFSSPVLLSNCSSSSNSNSSSSNKKYNTTNSLEKKKKHRLHHHYYKNKSKEAFVTTKSENSKTSSKLNSHQDEEDSSSNRKRKKDSTTSNKSESLKEPTLLQQDKKHSNNYYKNDDDNNTNINEPSVSILIQPNVSKIHPGILIGRNECKNVVSTSSTKECYPTIKIDNLPNNCDDEAVLVISCVNPDPPHIPHPNRLSLNDNSQKGVVSLNFQSTKELCLKELKFEKVNEKNDIESSLKDRESMKVDPFEEGFQEDYSFNPSYFRICFQVFLNLTNGDLLPLQPTVSKPIKVHTRPDNFSLNIKDINRQEIIANGGQELILTCENLKVNDSIKVILEQKNETTGDKIWSCSVKEPDVRVNEEGKLSFTAPPYKDVDIRLPEKVKFCLYRPRDKSFSKSFYIWYVPNVFFGKIEHEDDCLNESRISNDGNIGLVTMPKIGTPFSLSTSHGGELGDFKITTNSLEETKFDLPFNSFTTGESYPGQELVGKLKAEQEENHYLKQRISAMEKQHEEILMLKSQLEKDIVRTRIENKKLKETNIKMQEKLDELKESCENDAASKNTEEKIVHHFQDEIKLLQNKMDSLTSENNKLKFNQAIQSRGVSNMRWQLEQKDSTIRALELKLEETYPLPELGMIRGNTSDSSPSISSSQTLLSDGTGEPSLFLRNKLRGSSNLFSQD